MSKTKIVAIIGPSCSGKDTIIKRLLEKKDFDYNKILHLTTRPIRENESDGEDYIFTDRETMAQGIVNNSVYSVFKSENDWFYALREKDIDRSGDKINLSIFNTEDIENIVAEKNVELIVIYLKASAKTRFIRALQREKDPDINEIYRRYIDDDESFYWIETMIEDGEIKKCLEINTEMTTKEECVKEIVNYIKANIEV